MSVPSIASLHVAPQTTTAPAVTRTPAANATANYQARTKEARPAQSSTTAPGTGTGTGTGLKVDKHA
jgi:hypothetical protein